MTDVPPHSERAKQYCLPIRRPVTMAMLFLAAVVFGWKSYQELPLNLMPDISYPTLTVRTEYEGGAPEDIEKLVTRPLEETLSIVSGLVEISSISSAGSSEIIMEFTWDTDMNVAQQDVRDRLDLFDPPREVTEKPVILRYDPTLAPVLRVAVTGGDLRDMASQEERLKRERQDLTMIRDAAERLIKSDLEAEIGIAQVFVKGGREEEIEIQVDSERLKNLGLSLDSIVNSLAQQNINLSGGRLKEGRTEYLVRTLNEFRDVASIRDAIIGASNNQLIQLGDVATVALGEQDQETVISLNGREAVELQIYKEGDANTVQVCKKLKDLFGFDRKHTVLEKLIEWATAIRVGDEADESQVEEQRKAELAKTLRSRLPDYAQLTLISDQSRFIEGAIQEVEDAAIQGGALALIILYLFLRDIKSTMAIGIAIPISVIGTFVPMFSMGITLNIMSLGGLALGIGSLVDNSIVVLESVARCREEGDGVVEAADRGTKEVRNAVMASTFTTIAVYLPIAFVQGVAGQLFRDHALVVTFSQLASLLVALYLNPMLASRGKLTLLTGKDVIWAVGAYHEARTQGHSFLPAVLRILPISMVNSTSWLRNAVKDTFGPAMGVLRGNQPNPDRSAVAFATVYVFTLVGLPLLAVLLLLNILLKLLAVIFITILTLVVGVGFAAWLVVSKTLAAVFWLPLELFNRGFDFVKHSYEALVRQTLRYSIVVIAITLLITFHAATLIPRLGHELIPPMKQGEFSIRMEAPPGTRLEETRARARQIESLIVDVPEVQTVACEVGLSNEEVGGSRGENIAQFNILLSNPDVNIHNQDRIIDELRSKIMEKTSDEITFTLPTLFSFKTAIELQLRGDDTQTLRRVGEAALEKVAKVPGLTDAELSIKEGYPEIIIELDRDLMAAKGIAPEQVARRLRTEIQGDIATKFNRGGVKIDMRVRSDQANLKTLSDLRRLSVVDGNPPIPLDAVARISVQEGPSEIRRVDQQQVAVITGNVEGLNLASVAEEVLDAAEGIDKPADYQFLLGGQNRELEVSSTSLEFALLLAVFLVYVVMACQFESIVHPMFIMFAMPLAFIGVIYVLVWLKIDISITVYIGGIVLAGIVVNNAIVLVDYINQLRERGVPKREAIAQAGAIRLRPIMMTTITTVLGLIPMAMYTGEGSEIRRPMAITVMAGLITSTLLTLVIIPAIYDTFTKREKT